MDHTLVTYRVVYFKLHHHNSPYGASGRCTSVLSVCYLTNMEHFNTHHSSNRAWTNQGKLCDIMWMAWRILNSSHSVICQYLGENSCKCIKTILKVFRIKTFNLKWQNCKKNSLFQNIQDLIYGTKIILIFVVRRFLSLKNGKMCYQNSFSQFPLKILFFLKIL